MATFSEEHGIINYMKSATASHVVHKIPKDLPRANAGIAAIMAEAMAALELSDLPLSVIEALSSILAVGDAADTGVPVTAAAQLLEISDRTVRTWIKRGVLAKIAGSSPVRIQSQSLAKVLRAVRLLRWHEGTDARLLRYWGESENFEDLKARLSEMDQRTELDLNRLDEELFS